MIENVVGLFLLKKNKERREVDKNLDFLSLVTWLQNNDNVRYVIYKCSIGVVAFIFVIVSLKRKDIVGE